MGVGLFVLHEQYKGFRLIIVSLIYSEICNLVMFYPCLFTHTYTFDFILRTLNAFKIEAREVNQFQNCFPIFATKFKGKTIKSLRKTHQLFKRFFKYCVKSK